MEEMEAQEDEIDIDIDSMMVKGKLEKPQSPAPGSIASTASTSTDASKPQQQASSGQINSSSQPSPGIIKSDSTISSQYLEELKKEEALEGIIGGQKHLYSTQAQNLTESNAEYVIVAIKHFFENVVILQYEIQNTIEDQILSKVQVKISKFDSPSGLKVKGSVPLHEEDRIKYNEKRCAYVILNNQDCETPYPSLTIE